MIKLSNSISEIVPDGTNPQAIMEFLTTVKLCVEEIARKAKSIQETTRSTAPSTDDVEEKEDVDYVSGATIRRYTKIDGTVRYVAQT